MLYPERDILSSDLSFKSHKKNEFPLKVAIIHLPGFRIFIILPSQTYPNSVGKDFPLGSQRPNHATILQVRHPSEASSPYFELGSELSTPSTLIKVQEEFVSKIVSLKRLKLKSFKNCLELPHVCPCGSVEGRIENSTRV